MNIVITRFQVTEKDVLSYEKFGDEVMAQWLRVLGDFPRT